MNNIKLPETGVAVLLAAALLLVSQAAAATMGVREAASGLERQLHTARGGAASQSFQLPLTGTTVVLAGEARVEALASNRCRRTVELAHNQPFERKGLRITSLSRRSVEEGPCQNFGGALAAQSDASARSIAEQIGVAIGGIDSTPGERVLVAQTGSSQPARLHEAAIAPGVPVTLTVLEKAIIRDAPERGGEKLSRADAGTQLKAQRIAGNPDWFVLDGGLRFISASVVDVSDAATSTAPARGDDSRIRLKVMERAVLRNEPSFKGKKVASLAAGVERLARKVPGMRGWFELTDSDNRYPLYIHESVVDEKPGKKRL